jgi:signal transduction histidine kinase
VSNALKYTPAMGQITIDAQQTDKFIVFTITDTGIGIEQSLIDDFEQSNEVNSTQGLAGETGTGLGLRLCREYCLLNGGDFTLAKAADKGTKVSFTMLRA